MELYDSIKKIIDSNLYSCLIPLLLNILFIELFFKNRFKTKQVLQLIRWFLIFYFTIGILHYFIGIAFFPEKFSFIERATGPYRWAYWLMTFSAVVLPMTLFYKKWALNPFYLIFIAFFMKIGLYFERFVIIVTSYHRDYAPYQSHFDSISFWWLAVLLKILEGFVIAVLLLAIFEFIATRKTKHGRRQT